MQANNSFIDELKNTFKTGGMTTKLIFVNVAIFILIGIVEVVAKTIQGSTGAGLLSFVYAVFSLQTDISAFLTHPWGLFTSIFTHFSIVHLLFNMVFLFSVGRIFEQFFSAKRMLYTYIMGGVFGGLFEVIAHLVIPNFYAPTVIGASGAVLAILVATAFYQPKLTVSIWGLFNMRLIYLALIFILINLYNAGMGVKDGTAYFAHLGGAFLGYLSVQNPFGANNIIIRSMLVGDKLVNLFKRDKITKGKFTYSKSNASNTRVKTDEEYNVEAKERQAKIDKILDKIAKSGYESLTKEEKELLFSQSNK